MARSQKNKKLNKKDDRDDNVFWDQQQVEYLEENPFHLGIFAEVPDGKEDGMVAGFYCMLMWFWAQVHRP